MLVWNVTKTLSNPKDIEWEELTQSILGDDVHPKRKMGFLLAREALKNCLGEAEIQVSPKDLKLTDHCNLLGLSQFTISLSHTSDCGAALIGDRKTFRSVGIDIEHEERIVKDHVIERIAHESDETLRNIELWCLKEAAFKALMNSGEFEKPIEFSSIKIGNKEWSHSPTGLHGEWELKNVTPYVLAIASLKI